MTWRPGLDPRAVRHPATPAPAPGTHPGASGRVLVVGGGIAGLTAATGLAERGVDVVLVEREATLGGRVRSWPVAPTESAHPSDATDPAGPTGVTMSRGFHAFFRQYYNLRALLRRADPGLERLVPVPDYPLTLAAGPTDSFAGIPRTPPLSIAAFVARSPSFPLSALRRVDVGAALGLLDVRFPDIWSELDGVSAAEVLDRLRFPEQARHLALEVFARSFFADPRDFSGAELVAMFHTYFTGSAEGLLFDVPDDDYDTALWRPLAAHLGRLGVELRTGTSVTGLEGTPDGIRAGLDDGSTLTVDDVVLATDRATLQRLVADASWLGDPAWRASVAAQRTAPPFAVWRLWLDRPAAEDSPLFLGTSGYGPLDNVTFVDRMEAGAAAWSRSSGGCVVELHAYAVTPGTDERSLRDELRHQLYALHPELAGAGVLHEEWLLSQDCPLAGTDPWAGRPGVTTPDPRVVLAGDGIRCALPVALMERAATTGWQAADALLARRGLPGHDLWTVPLQGRGRAVAHALRGLLGAGAGAAVRQ
ncbi:NAD(P)/FAD-dependent oxidoreductase [Terrabacter sp. NPDC000476]|uniref:NAD(P)/FAD-dependent oxidoreductase n=1 Tax=Terrabacter sp. NPDC000476 TaxID=3154258 RepID=UPI003326D200